MACTAHYCLQESADCMTHYWKLHGRHNLLLQGAEDMQLQMPIVNYYTKPVIHFLPCISILPWHYDFITSTLSLIMMYVVEKWNIIFLKGNTRDCNVNNINVLLQGTKIKELSAWEKCFKKRKIPDPFSPYIPKHLEEKEFYTTPFLCEKKDK